jgi:hypothetical protein
MEQELEIAAQFLRRAEEGLAHQRELIADMERAGLTHAAKIAGATLEAMEAALATHKERFERLRSASHSGEA